MTKVSVTNNGEAPYGVETAGGRYRFIEPGDTRTVEAANLRALELRDDLDFEVIADVGEPPASLARKVSRPQLDHDGDGKAGGSPRGAQSTRSRGRRRAKRTK